MDLASIFLLVCAIVVCCDSTTISQPYTIDGFVNPPEALAGQSASSHQPRYLFVVDMIFLQALSSLGFPPFWLKPTQLRSQRPILLLNHWESKSLSSKCPPMATSTIFKANRATTARTHEALALTCILCQRMLR